MTHEKSKWSTKKETKFISNEKNVPEETKPEVVLFGFKGVAVSTGNSCFAKKTTFMDTDKIIYHIYARSNGILYNPFNSEDLEQVRDGQRVWNFKKVSKETIDFYLNFLNKKNAAFYNNAQRSMV